MIRDGDVGVARGARRLDHLGQRRLAVARVGVHLQIAADLLERYERRKLVRFCQRDLVAPFAQLGWDPLEVEGAVHVGFGSARNAFGSAIQSVLVQLELLGLGDLAQLDVVGLRAGEVLHCRAEGGRFDDAQVHLQPAGELYGRPGVAVRYDFFHLRELREPLDHRRGVLAAHHDVEIADRFTPPPEAAGDVDRVDAAARLEILHDGPGVLLGLVQHHPLRRAHGGAGNALPDLVEQFGAESLQLGDLALFERVLEVGHAVHLELLVEQLDPLGTETRDAQQVEQPRRNRGDEPLALRQGARRDERRDLLRDTAADPGQVRQVEIPARNRRDRRRCAPHCDRRVP